MGHNPPRRQSEPVRADTQRAVDEYKARSIWGAWWSLGEDLRRRYFNEDERAWIRRYGARLDEIACMSVEPRNDKERHFLAVCAGHEDPRTERERLWLRVQLVCRYQRSIDRAAATDLAVHKAQALEAENRQLRIDLRSMETDGLAAVEELQMLTGKEWVRPKRSVNNIEWATGRFQAREGAVPVALPVLHANSAHRLPTQSLPGTRPAIAH